MNESTDAQSVKARQKLFTREVQNRIKLLPFLHCMNSKGFREIKIFQILELKVQLESFSVPAYSMRCAVCV